MNNFQNEEKFVEFENEEKELWHLFILRYFTGSF